MNVLLQFANGAPSLPLFAINPRATGWIIRNTADKKYYLADTELAVAVQSYSTGGLHPALADRTLLYDLIPLASAIGTLRRLCVLGFEGVYDFFIIIDAGSVIEVPNMVTPSQLAWQYVRDHVKNQDCGVPPAKNNWPNFFRLAHNIYCQCHDTGMENYTVCC